MKTSYYKRFGFPKFRLPFLHVSPYLCRCHPLTVCLWALGLREPSYGWFVSEPGICLLPAPCNWSRLTCQFSSRPKILRFIRVLGKGNLHSSNLNIHIKRHNASCTSKKDPMAPLGVLNRHWEHQTQTHKATKHVRMQQKYEH